MKDIFLLCVRKVKKAQFRNTILQMSINKNINCSSCLVQITYAFLSHIFNFEKDMFCL